MADNDVKIKVSMEGDKVVISGLNGIGDAASTADSQTSKMAGGLKGAGAALVGFSVAAAAAGGALVTSVVSQYAAYEQNIGGIETMFKGSAGLMEQYASEAYRTAGLSANEYMSQATSFSAALLQGLAGDTEAAANYADMAMTDMSDNANKFGTNIGMIQNAYQGFAKQNFTMLDNLKLGYGGTREEMARLLNDSGVLEEGFVATAENLDSVSFDKVVEGIHAVQEQMGIAGTTAKEATETITGSIGMLQGAWSNLLVGLGSADADVATLAGNVITSFQTVVGNIVPVIQNIGTNIATLGPQLSSMMGGLVGAVAAAIPAILQAGVALVGGLITGIVSSLPQLVTAIVPAITQLVVTVAQLAPQLITAGVQAITALASGLAQAAPTLIPAIVGGVLGMVSALIAAAPMLIDAGLQLIMGLLQGILTAIPQIIAALPSLIISIVTFLISAIPQLMQAAIQLFTALITALPQIIAQLAAAIPLIIQAIVQFLMTGIPMLIQAGITLITSLVTALPQIITAIVAAIPQIITSVINAVLGAIPMLIEAGIQLFIALIGALPQIISTIIGAIPQIIGGVVGALVGAIPKIISTGAQVIGALANGFPQALGGIIGGIGQIMGSIIGAIGGFIGQVVSIGGDIVRGIWRGISGAAGWLMNQIGGFVKNVVGSIAGFFGIKSPSIVMEKQIGRWLPPGIGEGVEKNEDAAIKPIRALNAKILDEASKLQTSVAFTHEATLTQNIVPATQATPQAASVHVMADVDASIIGAAVAEGLATMNADTDQVPVVLSRESVAVLATAIVDAVRVQSRQGGVTLG